MDYDGTASDSELWELGCHLDDLRNKFLTPSLVAILEEHKPRTILDVGTATGYVPREVDKALSYRPDWTLVDSDCARLEFAKANAGSAMKVVTRCVDFMTQPTTQTKFDAVILTFTLLEMASYQAGIARVAECLQPNGIAIFALPDAWLDALNESSPECPRLLLSGTTKINKIDKFTRNPYPFNAVRTEYVIDSAIQNGLHLIGFKINRPTNDVFLMTFTQMDSTPHAAMQR